MKINWKKILLIIAVSIAALFLMICLIGIIPFGVQDFESEPLQERVTEGYIVDDG